MWKIYDEILDTIPNELTVLECMRGVNWTLVRSELGLGMAMTVQGGGRSSGLGSIAGMQLKKLAGYIKSWNMPEASLGQAAINAALNIPSVVRNMTSQLDDPEGDPEEFNGFTHFTPELRGKKVAVVGHFPGIEKLQDVCELSILERQPQPDDYPDPACEYILPEQDYVFITGTAFVNKTMPRLLELSKNAKIILIGPSVPVSRALFNYGVSCLASFVISEQPSIWRAVQEGESLNIFKQGGRMVCIHS
jgi:uncharacterized protein